MVKLKEVTESFEVFSNEESNYEESNYTSDDSDSNEDIDEPILDRLFALRDIIPVDTRELIASNISTIMRFSVRSAQLLGNTAWLLSTSALLILMPLAYEVEREHIFDQTYSQMDNKQMMGDSSSPYKYSKQQPIPLGHQPQSQGALIPPGF